MDSQKPEDPKSTQGAEHPEKPLGRGLEQISHLFLTQKLNELRGAGSDAPPPRGPEPVLSPVPSRPDARSILLRPNTSITRTRFIALLREFQAALAEGLRVTDVFLPCHPYGEIDALALDRANQLIIIDFDTAPTDALVLRGLAHCEWLVQNLPLVRRMHSGQTLHSPVPPRLFLLAPQFSPMMMGAARQLAQAQIHWVRYQVFDTGGAIGVSFEPVEP
jgi:hypothetical protein